MLFRRWVQDHKAFVGSLELEFDIGGVGSLMFRSHCLR